MSLEWPHYTSKISFEIERNWAGFLIWNLKLYPFNSNRRSVLNCLEITSEYDFTKTRRLNFLFELALIFSFEEINTWTLLSVLMWYLVDGVYDYLLVSKQEPFKDFQKESPQRLHRLLISFHRVGYLGLSCPGTNCYVFTIGV